MIDFSELLHFIFPHVFKCSIREAGSHTYGVLSDHFFMPVSAPCTHVVITPRRSRVGGAMHSCSVTYCVCSPVSGLTYNAFQWDEMDMHRVRDVLRHTAGMSTPGLLRDGPATATRRTRWQRSTMAKSTLVDNLELLIFSNTSCGYPVTWQIGEYLFSCRTNF